MIVVQFSWIFNGLPSPRFLWTKNLHIEENICCLTQNVCGSIILIWKKYLIDNSMAFAGPSPKSTMKLFGKYSTAKSCFR